MKIKHTYIKEKRPLASSSDEVYKLMKNIKDEKQEIMVLLCLDARNKVISKNIVSIGTLDMAMVHPRDILRTAILNNSKSVILVHNHPSGDSKPSDEDKAITKKIFNACSIMDIKLLDHIIVGNHYYSFSNDNKIG